MPTLTTPRRLLASSAVDLLLGPHGVDRYLELIRPTLTVRDARAEVLAVHRQTPRSVTLRLRPNRAFDGFRAGQYVRVGVEIDGVRHTRTYSPAGSEHATGELELTVTVHPQGRVSRHLHSALAPGSVLHLGPADGEFTLPDPRPERLVLISGGSGITPVLSMLRTLCDERHEGEIVFLHYARTAADWLYRDALDGLAARHPNLTVRYVATREGGGHLSAATVSALLEDGDLAGADVAACGPPALLDAVHALWAAAGAPERVHTETFTPLRLPGLEGAATGTLHFTRSERSVAAGSGSLLEQAEAAGLSPAFGCRMGICHTCTCRKAAGAVRNVLTGERLDGEDEDIQLCISVPDGDVALDL
jgi:ferredoxin-NADP reductase